jgi:hypothetical protein
LGVQKKEIYQPQKIAKSWMQKIHLVKQSAVFHGFSTLKKHIPSDPFSIFLVGG